MATLTQDLRHAARSLAKRPGFTAAAVLTLALGVGATTSIFMVVNQILLRPLPVGQPDRLVSVRAVAEDGRNIGSFSLPDYLDYRDGAAGSLDLAAHHLSDITISTGQAARVALGVDASGNYFDVLGLRPALGRFFHGSEARAGAAAPVAVISYEIWQTMFGGDPDAIGEQVTINGRPLTVIGVAPKSFHGLMLGARPAAWIPAGLYAELHPGSDITGRVAMSWLQLFGRLAPGTDSGRAERALSLTASRLAQAYDYPDFARASRARVERYIAVPPSVADAVTGFLGLLFAAATLVLLIAAVNVAGMLFARGAVRRREIATRVAIGAGRGRLLRQLLTESVLLAVLGGAGGILIAVWLGAAFAGVRPPGAGDFFRIELAVDWRVLTAATLFSIGVGVLAGLAPALRATRYGAARVLREGTPGGGRRGRLRHGMLVGQVALTVLLLVTAGLFVRTLRSALDMRHPFEPEGVLAIELNLRLNGYDEAEGLRFYDRLVERVRALPQTGAASVASVIPLGLDFDRTRVRVPGAEPAPGEPGVLVGSNTVSPGYFGTLRMPVLRGRAFTEADRTGPRVVIVNETFERRFWPDGSGVGRIVTWGAESAEIVGVVPDGRYRSFSDEPMPYGYVPLGQQYAHALWLQARPRGGDRAALVAAIREELRALDPDVPPVQVTTVEAVMASSLFPQRVAATLIGSFGVVGMLLAAAGLFGALAFSVAQRTREIGIRAALGATPRDTVGLVLRQALGLAGAGAAVGLGAAFAATRVLRGLLHGVSAADPLTFAAVSLGIMLLALAAAYVPARRAARVDPAIALRAE